MQAVILDFFDFHVCIYSDIEISRQKVSLMNRSLKILKDGTYMA